MRLRVRRATIRPEPIAPSQLQSRLRTLWPSITLRSIGDVERTRSSSTRSASTSRSSSCPSSRPTLKRYAATGDLDSPAYRTLAPDDLVDVVAERGLGWDAETETGVVLHMISALAVAGRIGVTVIGDTLAQARALYHEAKAAVDETAELVLA